MKFFLKNKTTKKIKIMLTAFFVVSIILMGMIINDFINYEVSFYYVFFIFIGLSISLVFRKDKSIKWDEKIEKVVKTTEITTVFIIISIITLRKFLLPDLFEYWHLENITTITLIITFGFFLGKFYFMWDKLRDVFNEIVK